MTDSGEQWRQRGYELVMRLGTPVERMEAQSRLAEVREIQKITAQWIKKQRGVSGPMALAAADVGQNGTRANPACETTSGVSKAPPPRPFSEAA